jgi:myo-inositol-1(or 4)-monophosphatase
VINPGTVASPLVAYATSRHVTRSASEPGRLFAEITARFRSMRLFGSAPLDFCYVVCGRFDCLVRVPAPFWDFYPGLFLVREAAGVVQMFPDSLPECHSLVIAASCQDVLETLQFVVNGVLAENYDVGRG